MPLGTDYAWCSLWAIIADFLEKSPNISLPYCKWRHTHGIGIARCLSACHSNSAARAGGRGFPFMSELFWIRYLASSKTASVMKCHYMNIPPVMKRAFITLLWSVRVNQICWQKCYKWLYNKTSRNRKTDLISLNWKCRYTSQKVEFCWVCRAYHSYRHDSSILFTTFNIGSGNVLIKRACFRYVYAVAD